mgnify:CR=1 FL=1
MPELPEVETVARGLDLALEGRTFTGVTVRWPRTVARPEPAQLEKQIIGRRVQSVGRRGKYVVVELDQGYLLIHLKMSGRLLVVAAGEPLEEHVHVFFDLDDGRQLRFHDVRKFGRVYLVDEPEQITAGLGPEPLDDDFTMDDFSRLLARRSGRLKSLLMNQQFLAGLGNIYVDESLFRARLHPKRRADPLDAEDVRRLYEAIQATLLQAIAQHGTTFDGLFVRPDGEAGRQQEGLKVYGQTGLPCTRCGALIERTTVGQRGTHFCPVCQPRPDPT